MESKENKKVLIALSGGIDSTVAAFLLKNQGHDVAAVAFQFIPGEILSLGGEDYDHSCHIENLEKIQKIAQDLGIDFYAVDARDHFEANVFDFIVSARLQGEYFSSCYACNQIKFSILHEKSKLLKCDYIATGHYAKIHRDNKGKIRIHSSNDIENDQAHLLSRVNTKYFQNLMLPLSELRKKDVIDIATKYELSYIDKLEKTNNCFFKSKNTKYIVEKKAHEELRSSAALFDNEEKIHLGDSEGLYAYYLGQGSIKTSDAKTKVSKNHVVTKIDMKMKEVQIGNKDDLIHRLAKICRLTFPKNYDRSKPQSLYIKSEDEKFHKCIVLFKNNNCALLEFDKPIYNLTPGSMISFFQTNKKSARLLGSGQVEDFDDFTPVQRVHMAIDLDDDDFDEDEDNAKTPSIDEIFDTDEFSF